MAMFGRIFKTRVELHTKWWHRLLTVIFVVSCLIVGPASFLIFDSEPPTSEKYSNIQTKLLDFVKKQDPNAVNVLPWFTNTYTQIGCAQDGEVKPIYLLDADSGVCSSNAKSHVSEIRTIMNKQIDGYNYGTPGSYFTDQDISEIITSFGTQEACLIPKEERDDCDYDNIVAYSHSNLVHLRAVGLSALLLAIWIAVVTIIYFKGIIYIVYEKKSDSF